MDLTRFNFEALLKTRALSDEESLKALPEKRRNELKERVEGAYAILARLLEEYGRLKDLFTTLEKGSSRKCVPRILGSHPTSSYLVV